MFHVYFLSKWNEVLRETGGTIEIPDTLEIDARKHKLAKHYRQAGGHTTTKK